MKKKVIKKSSTHKATSVKKGVRRHWSHLLPFKFSIISVAILGCLTLVAGGVYDLMPKTDVLGATKKPVEHSDVRFAYAKFVPDGSNFTIDTSKFDIGVKMSVSRYPNFSWLSGGGVLYGLPFNKTVELQGNDPTFNVKLENAFINFKDSQHKYDPTGEKSASSIYIVSSKTYTYNNTSNQCTYANPCIFTVRLVTKSPTPIPTRPTPTPKPTKCTTSSKTVCYGNQVCTQTSSSCSTIAHYTNCSVRPGYCEVSQKTSRGIQQ